MALAKANHQLQNIELGFNADGDVDKVTATVAYDIEDNGASVRTRVQTEMYGELTRAQQTNLTAIGKKFKVAAEAL